MKLVEYPTLTRGAEAKEMNALENYLLSHVEVYHDAFSEPDVQSLLFCKLCNSRINVNYKCFEETDFAKYVSFHFCADEGKTFFSGPNTCLDKNEAHRCKFTGDNTSKVLQF